MGSVGAKYNATSATGVSTPQPQQQPQQPQQVAAQPPTPDNTPVTPNGVTKLSQMSDAELAQLVRDAKKVVLPNQLADVSDITQKVVYQAGLNEKPMVLDRQEFDQFIRDNNIPQAEVLSRSIGGGNYTNQMQTSIRLTPSQISDMLKYSRFNYIGGKVGGMAYGAGTYFAATGSIGSGTGYGGYTMNAVLNPNTAKIVSKSQLRTLAARFAQSHPQFAKAVGSFSYGSGGNASVYALAMGYNVIADNSTHNTGGDYVNVLIGQPLCI